ncbi:MAG: hypothetical protein SOW25_06865, partial [Helicobacter sp.]|nr:hypothetical protein [Helicobacter sp.]
IKFFIIAFLVVILLVFLVQLLSKYELISQKTRLLIGILFLLVAFGIGIFSFFQDKKEENLTILAQGFLQGKTLICKTPFKEIKANKENFNFISGTLTLSGKESGEFFKVTIPLKACELENDKAN